MKESGYDFIECGSCGCYHKPDWYGDCRDDAHRFTFDQIPEDARVLTIEEQMEDEDEGEPYITVPEGEDVASADCGCRISDNEYGKPVFY